MQILFFFGELKFNFEGLCLLIFSSLIVQLSVLGKRKLAFLFRKNVFVRQTTRTM
jgi:hypothetical protein